MRLDRGFQLELLTKLRGLFPYALDVGSPSVVDHKTAANVAYLIDHGLVQGAVEISTTDRFHIQPIKITARGIDLLSGDGGMSAILGVVTVRFHADTIRDMIAAKIDASPASAGEKSTLRKHLADLSETGLKAAMGDLIKLGLAHLPDAIPWLQKLAGL